MFVVHSYLRLKNNTSFISIVNSTIAAINDKINSEINIEKQNLKIALFQNWRKSKIEIGLLYFKFSEVL